jgi:hypothetical protein
LYLLGNFPRSFTPREIFPEICKLCKGFRLDESFEVVFCLVRLSTVAEEDTIPFNTEKKKEKKSTLGTHTHREASNHIDTNEKPMATWKTRKRRG